MNAKLFLFLVGVALGAQGAVASAQPPAKECATGKRATPTGRRPIDIDGDVKMSCRVDVKGCLYECQILSEAPPGLGFGDAALAMSKIFKMRPKTSNGEPVEGGQVTIPLHFAAAPPDSPKR